MQKVHCFFWERHPALLYAVTLLIGISAALFWHAPWNWIFPILWTAYLLSLKKWPAMLLLPAMAVYCHLLYPYMPGSMEAEGIFNIATMQTRQTPFQKGYVYKGTLYLAEGAVPCTVYSKAVDPPRADCDYFLRGRLDRRGPFEYAFKPKQWTPLENSKNFAHRRYLLKERYRHFLIEQFTAYPRVADFFFALTTGELENRMMRYEFERLGLQHILGVSGFHFAILAAVCSFGLSFFLPRRGKWLILLLALNAYFLFVGNAPAVQRCWLMASAYLASKLLNRPTNGLNLLGFTMGVEVIASPLIVPNIGFQLSFASCIGIFLLHPLCEKRLRALLPKRPPEKSLSLSLLSKHAYLLSSFLRQAISLSLAVNAAILPILLVHFHVFPLLSLFYNLFYPFCADAALFALFLSLILQFLFPPLAALLFSATGWFAARLLDLAAYPPPVLDHPLLIPHLPALLIPFYLFLLFSASLRHSCSDC